MTQTGVVVLLFLARHAERSHQASVTRLSKLTGSEDENGRLEHLLNESHWLPRLMFDASRTTTVDYVKHWPGAVLICPAGMSELLRPEEHCAGIPPPTCQRREQPDIWRYRQASARRHQPGLNNSLPV